MCRMAAWKPTKHETSLFARPVWTDPSIICIEGMASTSADHLIIHINATELTARAIGLELGRQKSYFPTLNSAMMPIWQAETAPL